MDLLAHALYGATVCSRTGFAGGSKGAPRGAGRPVITDWTAWTAALFGILPDIISMGPSFVAFWQGGMEGNFFRDLPDSAIVYYHYTHSLIVALAVSGVLWLVWKPLFVCSLAWPLHVGIDALTHDSGKFATTLFYPLSTWSLDGIRWWRHPEVVLAYWLALPVIWLGLWTWRRRRRLASVSHPV